MSEFEGLVAAVTGGASGIGKAVATLLAERGAQVAVLDLKPDDDGFRCDVSSDDEVRQAIDAVVERFGRLDILVNNAGIVLPDGPPSQATAEQARLIYETNVFGVIEVTNAMLPMLRRSPAGRVVNVSSERGSITRALDRRHPLWPMLNVTYCSAKAALNMITVSYAKELLDTPVKVNAVDPGWVKTDINHGAGIKTPEEGAAPIVAMALLGPDGPTAAFVQDEGPIPF